MNSEFGVSLVLGNRAAIEKPSFALGEGGGRVPFQKDMR
jgi:hypothetical protein